MLTIGFITGRIRQFITTISNMLLLNTLHVKQTICIGITYIERKYVHHTVFARPNLQYYISRQVTYDRLYKDKT
jgi:hypothetical protein